MISLSRLIAGIFFILMGIGLIVASFFVTFIFLIYAIPMLLIGVWLLLNKNEDKIEERLDEVRKTKSLNKKKSKY